MNYLQYTFTVNPPEPGSDILIALLADIGFESFTQNETGLDGYIQFEMDNESLVKELTFEEFSFTYTRKEIPKTNWNEEWEKNLSPVYVDDLVCIRAHFHNKAEQVKHDIVITPKMSFGTGHHETTHMMIQHLLEMDVKDLKTLDIGCGTAILAILAEMKGAQPIDAIDIDNWCYLNSIENAERNNCQHISVYEGDAALLKDKKYDLIIANINRNILLNDMQSYVDCLNPGGTILFSGFYEEDIPFIDGSCTEKGLTYIKKFQRNNWVSLKYVN